MVNILFEHKTYTFVSSHRIYEEKTGIDIR